jgi:hypothetical protein
MFSFFKRKEPPPVPVAVVVEENPDAISKWHEDESIDACIVYYVKKDGETCVDIEISEYHERVMDNFYSLLEVVGREGTYVETLEMVKDGFVKAGREDLFLKLATRITLDYVKNSKEKPCLRPSDVL